MAITQRELAKKLGISRQIVGQALSGHSRVAESTRRRVLSAAALHGYTSFSNQDARALIARRYGKRVRHDMIAVMTGDAEGALMRDVPFFAPLFHGIEEEAVSRDVDVAVHTLRVNYLPRYIREKRVDGVIAFVTTSERNQGMYEDGVVLLTVGNRQAHASSLTMDDYCGIELTTQHLIHLGHRNIAYLGQDKEGSNGADRLRAFEETMARNALPVRHDMVEATLISPSHAAGYNAACSLHRRAPGFTALVCYNDTIAMGATEYLRSIGIKAPRDISITGFDDVSSHYQFKPKLTSVSFDRHAMGRRAVAAIYEMFERIEQDEPDSPLPLIHEIFPVELVVRDSTGAPRKSV